MFLSTELFSRVGKCLKRQTVKKQQCGEGVLHSCSPPHLSLHPPILNLVQKRCGSAAITCNLSFILWRVGEASELMAAGGTCSKRNRAGEEDRGQRVQWIASIKIQPVFYYPPQPWTLPPSVASSRVLLRQLPPALCLKHFTMQWIVCGLISPSHMGYLLGEYW